MCITFRISKTYLWNFSLFFRSIEIDLFIESERRREKIWQLFLTWTDV